MLSFYLRFILSKLNRLFANASVIGKPALIASVSVTSLVLGIRQLGWLESTELDAFDRMMQLRPAAKIDPRLLIVTITENDLQTLKTWPLSDRILYQLLNKLDSYQPRVIGLDVYRDFAVEPGHSALTTLLQNSDRIIPVCKVKDADTPEIPPPNAVKIEQVGFSDLLIDSGRIIRRGLLFQDPFPQARCQTSLSFGFQIAQHYLAKENIRPIINQQNYLQLGKTVFKPLETNSGGYHNLNAQGYQILLNYPASEALANQVTLSQVLAGNINPTWVKDKIVLIGSTAPSLKDIFYSPFKTADRYNQKIPGIFVHGQIVSQIISAALNQYKLFWFLPKWGEAILISCWSLTAGLLIIIAPNLKRLIIIEITALIILVGSSWGMFLLAGWIPVIPSLLVFIGTSGSLIAYNTAKSQQEYKRIIAQAKEQETTIALLQTLLNDQTEQLQSIDIPTQQWENQDYNQQTEPLDNTATWDQNILDNPDINSGLKPKNNHSVSALLAGRYNILKVLNSGGFGVTYLAKDTQRPGNPECVVKHLKPARCDQKFLHVARRLFQTEAEILEKLGKHSQIPYLLAYFEENQEFYLVEEFILGHCLSEEIVEHQCLPVDKVVNIMREILQTLVFIHDHSVIHRDIKPSNIIRRQSDGKLVLIDFGAVKQIQPQTLETEQDLTVAIGTRGYTPPEQYAGKPGFSSDIYAVGIIGIQALTGIKPYHLSLDTNTGNLQWSHLTSIDENLAQILNKMVCYHFVERYQSVRAVLQDLKRY